MGTRVNPDLSLVDCPIVAAAAANDAAAADDASAWTSRASLRVQWRGLRWRLDDKVPPRRVAAYEVELVETSQRPPRALLITRDDDSGDVPLPCSAMFHSLVPGCRYAARVRWHAAPPTPAGMAEVSEWVRCEDVRGEATIPTPPRLQMQLPVQTFAARVRQI